MTRTLCIVRVANGDFVARADSHGAGLPKMPKGTPCEAPGGSPIIFLEIRRVNADGSVGCVEGNDLASGVDRDVTTNPEPPNLALLLSTMSQGHCRGVVIVHVAA